VIFSYVIICDPDCDSSKNRDEIADPKIAKSRNRGNREKIAAGKKIATKSQPK